MRTLKHVVAVIALVGAALILTPTPASAVASCTPTADNPHWSSGAGGVIVKGRTTCTSDTGQVIMETFLYFYTGGSWQFVKYGTRTISNASGGTEYTQYAPPLGQAGAGGCCYWQGALRVTYYNESGTYIANPLVWSNVVYVNAT